MLDNFERAAAAVKTSTDAEASINNSYQSVGKEMLKVAQLGVPGEGCAIRGSGLGFSAWGLRFRV